MLRTIIEKEFLEKILTLRFLVALLLSFGLTTWAGFLSVPSCICRVFSH